MLTCSVLWAAGSLFSAALLHGTAATAGPTSLPKRSNVLFLFSDDQRPDTIHALGNAVIVTPHLDRLARNGTVFTRVVSPNPLCVPARKEILSGCCGIRNGLVNFGPRFDRDQVPLPRALRQAGYHTWHVGKWHSEGRPKDCGYEESLGLFMLGAKPVPGVDHTGRRATGYQGAVFQTDDGKLFPEKGVGLTPDISREFADAAISFIRRQPAEPFLLHVNFTAPHDPLLIPPGYEGKYDPAKIPLPPNFLPEHPFDHGNFRGRDELLFAWPRTSTEVRAELAAYYAVISHLDEQIGRILAALKDTGQLDNTVIIFSSDQGLAMGSHGLRGKQNMYEHTVGTSLIICGPGVPEGARRTAQCYLRDLYPTICEMAGAEVPAVVQGKSLVPVLRDDKHTLYPAIFGYFGPVQRMIRTDQWKLIYYPEIDRYQLFDLGIDPYELKDLSGDPQHATALRDLRAKLTAWQKDVKDPLLQEQ